MDSELLMLDCMQGEIKFHISALQMSLFRDHDIPKNPVQFGDISWGNDFGVENPFKPPSIQNASSKQPLGNFNQHEFQR